MRKLQASYNDNAKKIVKEAGQKKAKENLNFLIDLATIAMVAEDTKPMKNEPQAFNKPGIILIPSHKENGKRPFKRSLGI